jgi:alkylated DNA repair dioxygenase AlkB
MNKNQKVQQLSLFDNQVNIKPAQLSLNNLKSQGLQYVNNFLSLEEENALLQKIDQQVWLTDLKRRVQHYGYKYNYKTRTIDKSLFLGGLPNWALEIVQKIYQSKYLDILPDQVIVNEYEPGQGITPHIDCPSCFTDTIISLSLGSSCLMDFIHKSTQEKQSILLESRSLIVLKGEARYQWLHGIAPRKKDVFQGETILRGRRISLTFRKVILADVV